MGLLDRAKAAAEQAAAKAKGRRRGRADKARPQPGLRRARQSHMSTRRERRRCQRNQARPNACWQKPGKTFRPASDAGSRKAPFPEPFQ